MSIVVPAILPSSRKDLEEKLARLQPITSITDVQIDVVDGRFAAPATWPYTSDGFSEMLPLWERFRYDIDLMVADPEAVTGAWIGAGAARLTVHAESTTYVSKLITELTHKFGHEPGLLPNLLSLGLAIGIDTDNALVEQYAEVIDYVQFMGIAKIGVQGQPFDPRVLYKIKSFHKRYPELLIQVDGGVSLQTAPQLLDAGVGRLIVGSALEKAEDVEAEIAKFDALTN